MLLSLFQAVRTGLYRRLILLVCTLRIHLILHLLGQYLQDSWDHRPKKSCVNLLASCFAPYNTYITCFSCYVSCLILQKCKIWMRPHVGIWLLPDGTEGHSLLERDVALVPFFTARRTKGTISIGVWLARFFKARQTWANHFTGIWLSRCFIPCQDLSHFSVIMCF